MVSAGLSRTQLNKCANTESCAAEAVLHCVHPFSPRGARSCVHGCNLSALRSTGSVAFDSEQLEMNFRAAACNFMTFCNNVVPFDTHARFRLFGIPVRRLLAPNNLKRNLRAEAISLSIGRIFSHRNQSRSVNPRLSARQCV